MRLHRSDPATSGYTRRRHGTGFTYLDAHSKPLGGDEKQRCQDLVIPPAWTDVWICPDPAGHLQAVGTDDAGRRQYLYHPQWRLAGIGANLPTSVTWPSRCRNYAAGSVPT